MPQIYVPVKKFNRAVTLATDERFQEYFSVIKLRPHKKHPNTRWNFICPLQAEFFTYLLGLRIFGSIGKEKVFLLQCLFDTVKIIEIDA